MSVTFDLYRAPEGTDVPGRWEKNHAERLGTVGEVKDRLSELFPELRWKQYGALDWRAWGPNRDDDPYLELYVSEFASGPDSPGGVYFVSLNKPDPKTVRTIQQALRLNHAYAVDANTLMDPSGDSWRVL